MKYYEPRPLTHCHKADISIQGGRYHYSKPKIHLDNIQDYEAVEIALFTKDSAWIQPATSPILTDFSRLKELLELYKEGENPVGCRVPIDLVNALIVYLNTKG